MTLRAIVYGDSNATVDIQFGNMTRNLFLGEDEQDRRGEGYP